MKTKPKAYSMGVGGFEIIYRCGNKGCDFTFNMANSQWNYCPCCGKEIDWGVVVEANEEWKQKFLSVMEDKEKLADLLKELDTLNLTIKDGYRRKMNTTKATKTAIRKSNAQYYLGIGWTKEDLLKKAIDKIKELKNSISKLKYSRAELERTCAERLQRIEKKQEENAELKEQLKDTIKLPCKVGDTIYVVPSETNFCLNAMFGHKTDNRIYEQIIESINFYKAGVYMAVTCDGLYTNHSKLLNETWFLTKELAENRLKELEGKQDERN